MFKNMFELNFINKIIQYINSNYECKDNSDYCNGYKQALADIKLYIQDELNILN